MAPRTLHFTKDEMFWECAALPARETAPIGLPVRRLKKGFHGGQAKPMISELRLGVITFLSAYPSSQEISRFWLRLAEDFASRRLTYHTDKLAALSGIAHAISEQDRTGLRYWAGVWDAGALEGLYWIPKHAGHRSDDLPRRYGSYVAPSWSWASMDGAVFFGPQPTSLATGVRIDQEQIDRLSHTPALQVVGYLMEPRGLDPYGQGLRRHPDRAGRPEPGTACRSARGGLRSAELLQLPHADQRRLPRVVCAALRRDPAHDAGARPGSARRRRRVLSRAQGRQRAGVLLARLLRCCGKRGGKGAGHWWFGFA